MRSNEEKDPAAVGIVSGMADATMRMSGGKQSDRRQQASVLINHTQDTSQARQIKCSSCPTHVMSVFMLLMLLCLVFLNRISCARLATDD